VPVSRRVAAVGAGLEVVAVLVFVAIGRSSHQDGLTVAGMASTSWPFLVGLVTGWLLVRAWQRPTAMLPTGITVWISCVALGMVLRALAGQGTAAAFIAVALGFLGLEVLGWRALARLPVPSRSDR
jgi:Protein of unknown function (DUF3054)